MDKEKLCIVITAAICIFGCAFISVYNMLEANYSGAYIIPESNYNKGILISQSDKGKSNQHELGTININTASAEEIADFLPGIGEKKARKIVEYRELAGEFVSIDELIKVEGIGEKTLENIRPNCRLKD